MGLVKFLISVGSNHGSGCLKTVRSHSDSLVDQGACGSHTFHPQNEVLVVSGGLGYSENQAAECELFYALNDFNFSELFVKFPEVVQSLESRQHR